MIYKYWGRFWTLYHLPDTWWCIRFGNVKFGWKRTIQLHFCSSFMLSLQKSSRDSTHRSKHMTTSKEASSIVRATKPPALFVFIFQSLEHYILTIWKKHKGTFLTLSLIWSMYITSLEQSSILCWGSRVHYVFETSGWLDLRLNPREEPEAWKLHSISGQWPSLFGNTPLHSTLVIGSKGSLEKIVILVVCNNLLLMCDKSNLESHKKDLKLVDCSE